MAPVFDLVVDGRAGYTRKIEYRQADGITAVDIDGWWIGLDIRRVATDLTPLVSLREDDGLVRGATGVIFITLTAEQTTLLSFGTYVYDLLVKAPGLEPKRILQGSVVVTAGVTVDA